MEVVLKNGTKTTSEAIKSLLDRHVARTYGKKPIIEWDNNTIEPTKWWYDTNDNKIHTDCTVTIEYNEPLTLFGAYCCIDDLINLIIEYYKGKSIFLTCTRID